MALLRPALPGELEEMKERLRKVLAGEDEEFGRAALRNVYDNVDEETEDEEYDIHDAGFPAIYDALVLLYYRGTLVNICEDRLPELTDEQLWALPDDFSTLSQWGLVVSDAEVETSLAIYMSLYFIEVYEEMANIRALCYLRDKGFTGDDAAWLAGIERS